MISFGPVPSRRLGRSLGINNIPPKICSYSCVYCQLGRTLQLAVERQGHYQVEEVIEDVKRRVREAQSLGEEIDYLTFVPDGEPTLDLNLGLEIRGLRPLGIPIAVISNASLIWREDVRKELAEADWVSLKMDAVEEETWRQINRPYGDLALSPILEGALAFAREFQGTLVTETLLVKGLNDSQEDLGKVRVFLAQLKPARAYLSIPTRPPAEGWVHPPDEEVINRDYQILAEKLPHVEYLIGYEGDLFASTGDAREDLLDITAVHPMREDAVGEFLERTGNGWGLVRDLVNQEELIEAFYGDHRFYLRKLRRIVS